ncbi:sterol desaturase family protein [Flavihumibacter petaseus]|uniref:Putative fatty acid hydroxylase n=1 Tax=Flavihumibacter petaseus NBRC 106054 TaxID=1220578 RepID=A0A0E9N3V0_9BACT|nr:sterol desaturase family protein [Flavihumibacter petaseus]GAO44657.1 putative fatty acid hydroxylase [Flavihumibacter petaseus NBRC 106054]
MKFEKIHNKGQARLFDNRILEMLTKTHPLVIWAMYIPIISYLFYLSMDKGGLNFWRAALTFGSGVFFWTFFEYIMHRFAFHFISEDKGTQRFIYVMHGNHHEYPRDKERLFMPPLPSLMISSTLLAIFYGIGYLLDMPFYALPFFGGFIFGYLLYGSMHYAIHAWKPPFKFMKPLWRNHHLHHYKDEGKGYGVSTTIWDRVFGTMFDVSDRNAAAGKEERA